MLRELSVLNADQSRAFRHYRQRQKQRSIDTTPPITGDLPVDWNSPLDEVGYQPAIVIVLRSTQTLSQKVGSEVVVLLYYDMTYVVDFGDVCFICNNGIFMNAVLDGGEQ
jgi:hypothetical protein